MDVKGIITGITTGATTTSVDVKIVSRVSDAGVETQIDYAEGDQFSSFDTSDTVFFVGSDGNNDNGTGDSVATAVDWYDQQTLGLTNSTVYWSTIAPKPGTSLYADERQGKNDLLHVAVVDDNGDVTELEATFLRSMLIFLRQVMQSLMSMHLRRFTIKIISEIFLRTFMLAQIH